MCRGAFRDLKKRVLRAHKACHNFGHTQFYYGKNGVSIIFSITGGVKMISGILVLVITQGTENY